MRRRLVLVLASVLLGTACQPGPEGAREPSRPQDLGALDASDDAAARGAIATFLRAYVDAPRDGTAPLAALGASRWLEHWVHWLGVQIDAFPGTQTAELQLTSISGTEPVAIPDQPGDLIRQMELTASARFHFQPDQGDPFDVTRVLDGPVRVFQAAPDHWLVVDFTREGVPMSRAFQVLPKDASWEAGDYLTVRMDSFVSVPAWQFDLVVQVHRGSPASLTPAGAQLIDADGKVVEPKAAITDAFGSIEVGAKVEGIVSFDLQPSVKGLTLRLSFSSRTPVAPLDIPLEDLIEPVPIAPAPTAAPSG